MAIDLGGGFRLVEDATPEKRGDRAFMPRSSRASRTFQLRALSGADVTDAVIYAATKALAGYATTRVEIVGGVTRRWIERRLPDRTPPIEDDDLNPDGELGPRCVGSPRVWPMTAGVNDAATGWPGHRSPGGVWVQAQYEMLPYYLREDDAALAEAGPLSADTPAGAEARPDEGDALRRGWASASRFVYKDEQPASRTISLPGGMVLYADEYIAPGTPVRQGLPYVQYKSTVKYSWFNVPVDSVPEDAIRKMGNRANAETFDGYPAGTLLYISTAVDRWQAPTYDWLATLTHHFAHLPNYDDINLLDVGFRGWNAIPALVTTGLGLRRIRMARISADGNAPTGGNALFQPGDTPSLFRPPQG